MNDFFKDRKGNPIIPLGMMNLSAPTDTDAELNDYCDMLKEWGGNTITIPIFWNWIEPEMDRYDMTVIRRMIDLIGSHGLHLCALWFATSKNGHPNFAPDYIKLDPQTYQIAIGPDGSQHASLSPHGRATNERDAKAFCELLKFIKRYDTEGVVIAMQVENEMGYANTDRDYSKVAQRDYEKPLPSEMVGVGALIEDTGERTGERTWVGEFGRHAHEAFSAYYHAKYVDYICEKGKQVYDLPMYVNVMLGEQNMEEAGLNYNAGCASGRLLDVWKKAAPHIDLLCPDVYCPSTREIHRVFGRYARKDNALFAPEILGDDLGAMNLFRMFCEYDAIGYIGGGKRNKDGSMTDYTRRMSYSIWSVRKFTPLFLKYRGQGRIHALIQDEFAKTRYLRLPNWHVLATFTNTKDLSGVGGFFGEERARMMRERGRAMVCQEDDWTFYVTGAGVELDFRRRPDPREENSYPLLCSRQSTQLNHLSVEEGHFGANGDWVCDKERNGDWTNYGLYLYDGVMVRLRLNPAMCSKPE